MKLFKLASLVVLATMVLASAASAVVYDITADFSIDNGNPNGAWSYGWAPLDFSAFNLYTNHGPNGNGLSWYGWGADQSPSVWKNTSWPVNEVPSGWVSIHPGNGCEPSIARWTAPAGVTGTATITGLFLPGDSGREQVAVRKNNTEIWHAVDSGIFDLVTAVTPGDTIDFAVYAAYAGGNTPVNATISVVPEPSTLLTLLSGIGGLGGLMWRRRK